MVTSVCQPALISSPVSVSTVDVSHPEPSIPPTTPALLLLPLLHPRQVLRQLRLWLLLRAGVQAGVQPHPPLHQPAALPHPAQFWLFCAAVQDSQQSWAVQPAQPAAVQHRVRREVRGEVWVQPSHQLSITATSSAVLPSLRPSATESPSAVW